MNEDTIKIIAEISIRLLFISIVIFIMLSVLSKLIKNPGTKEKIKKVTLLFAGIAGLCLAIYSIIFIGALMMFILAVSMM